MRITTGLAVLLLLGAAAGPVCADGATKVQRSAQSDCRRELERRGYTALATRNYRQYQDGWSLEMQARDYKGRTTWGTCYVETGTGDVSLYGFGWGGSGTGTGDFQFYCASPDYKYRECQLPVDGRARLVKKKSDASCAEGRDWGQRGDRIWIDHGCRANFEVVRYGGGPGGGNSGQQHRAEVQCRSQAGREGVAVRSVAAAVPRGSYWETNVEGTRDGQVVQPICRYYPSTNRADLYYSKRPGDTGTGERGSAERACVNQAERQGLRVVDREAAQAIKGGYGMRLTVRRASQPPQAAYCTFLSSTGRAELRY